MTASRQLGGTISPASTSVPRMQAYRTTSDSEVAAATRRPRTGYGLLLARVPRSPYAVMMSTERFRS